MAESKNPLVKLLLGNWLGHPLHPAVVHIPIALWLGALLFDVLNLTGVSGLPFVRTSYWCIAIGLLSGTIVVPSGLAEWLQIDRKKPAFKLGLLHLILNVVVMGFLIVSLIVRSGAAYNAENVPLSAFVLLLIGDAILGVSGYVGGRMVYDKGTAVARMSKDKWRQIAAAGKANLPPES